MTSCTFGVCAFGRQCVEGTGPLDADILLLGEAPGKVELQEGVPFVGPSGRLLDRLLASADLDRTDIRITNTCGCVDMSREDKRPLPAELDACRPRLDAEIALVRPKAVVLMGNTALQTFFPGYKIGEIYGHVRQHPDGFVVIPTYHPAHVLRGNKQVEPVIEEALKTARRFAA